MARPALGLHTANPGVQTLSRELPIMQTYDRMQAAFPGGALPAVVVAKVDDASSPEVLAAVDELEKRARATGKLSEPVTHTSNPDGTVLIVNVPVQGDGSDARSEAGLAVLRESVVPATLGTISGGVLITGLLMIIAAILSAAVGRRPHRRGAPPKPMER